MPTKARLFRREVLPFVASFALLAVAALALDGLLHLLKLLWIGRWRGIPATATTATTTAVSSTVAGAVLARATAQGGSPCRLQRAACCRDHSGCRGHRICGSGKRTRAIGGANVARQH